MNSKKRKKERKPFLETQTQKKLIRSRHTLKKNVKVKSFGQKANNKNLDVRKVIRSTKNGKYRVNIKEMFSFLKIKSSLRDK